MQYYLLTLGCPKNTVDSEGMAMLLSSAGYQGVSIPKNADVIIVNTCGFLEAAAEESLAALRDLAQHKRRGQTLIAAGCMAQRAGDRIVKEVPGVDGLLGTRRWMEIVPFVQGLRGGAGSVCWPLRAVRRPGTGANRRYAPAGGGRRQRLSEDQRRLQCACAFCSIPTFKGKLRSRPQAGIVAEARALVASGARGVILIARGYQRLWPRPGPVRLAA